MKRTSIYKRTIIIVQVMLVFAIPISACAKETPIPSGVIETIPPNSISSAELAPSAASTQTPEITLSLNGYPLSLSHPLKILHDLLWLPAKEIFQLLEISNINREDTFISAAFTKEDGNWVNCHFPVGENSFSTDTTNNVWVMTEFPAFIEDGEIYLTQEMLEHCIGTFIQFDLANKTADLQIPERQISPIQENNVNPIAFISLKNPNDLENSKVNSMISGLIKSPASDWLDWVDRLKEDGFTGTRSTLSVLDAPAVDESLGTIEEEIPADYIAIFQKLQDLGITTRYSLSFWDLAYRNQGGKISYQRLNTPEEVDRYLEYVRMVVTNLKGLVDEYELWNEPDANRDWYQRIEPEDYIAVAKQAIPIIREIDPEAKIVLVSTSSYVDLSCQEYTNIILESDILSMGDAISLHTLNNDASPEFLSDYYYGYDEMWKAIKAKAEANGFSGEYYADELNYRSEYSLSVLQPEPGNYHPYAPEVAAKYIGRMIAANLGMDISVGTSGTNIFERPAEGGMIRNMAYMMEGLRPDPFEVETVSDSDFVRYYTFSDQDGNSYLVLWNDVAAQVESQDIKASITIKGVSALSVTGINPYLANSQPLVFSNTTNGLIVDQLLIKDYPLIIKFEN